MSRLGREQKAQRNHSEASRERMDQFLLSNMTHGIETIETFQGIPVSAAAQELLANREKMGISSQALAENFKAVVRSEAQMKLLQN